MVELNGLECKVLPEDRNRFTYGALILASVIKLPEDKKLDRELLSKLCIHHTNLAYVELNKMNLIIHIFLAAFKAQPGSANTED